ncbi:MAG: hypothetical protein ACTSX9_01830 [Candidatus Njordarchaeales archaeon]
MEVDEKVEEKELEKEVEFIKKIFSEEFVESEERKKPHEKISAEKIRIETDISQVLMEVRENLSHISEEIEKLRNDFDLLLNSVNEIKGILLLSARPPEKFPRKGIGNVFSRPSSENIDEVLREIEKTVFSPVDKLIVQAIKVEGLKIWLEELFDEIEKGHLEIPEDRVSEAKKLYKLLLQASRNLRDQILLSAR